MLSKFIERFYSDDLDQEEKDLIDDLAKLSNPDSVSTRYEYEKTMDKVFGEGTADHFDKKDIGEMLSIAKKNLPSALADTFSEIEEDVSERALSVSKDLHQVTLATATSIAVEEMTDKVIAPTDLLEPWELSNVAYGVAEVLSDHMSDEESEEENSDDYGFDDDDYEEY